MLAHKKIKERLFTISSNNEFNELALEIFHYQYNHNTIYASYVNALKINNHKLYHYSQIPCLPISFFKSHQVACFDVLPQTTCFSSSGTTGQITSKHYVKELELYESAFNKGFELFYGNPSQYCILALLPNYLERSGSSLVYMFDKLITQSHNPLSGFYLNNYDDLVNIINQLKQTKQKTILLGVTYALLNLAELDVKLDKNFVVMETGGMKGKRQEMIKEELHTLLKKKLQVTAIHSEYGMTELLSQAYSKENGIFETTPWMRLLIRDTNDPFHYLPTQRVGGVNVIDLANVYSCSFIETKDLAKIHPNNTFEMIGRFDNSDVRGCNLMMD